MKSNNIILSAEIKSICAVQLRASRGLKRFNKTKKCKIKMKETLLLITTIDFKLSNTVYIGKIGV
jgi:hypothetical protein